MHGTALALLLFLGSMEPACAGGGPAAKAPTPRSAVPSAAARGFDFTRGVGMVEGDRPDSLWLMIADSTLAIGDSLTLIADEPDPDPASPPQILTAAVAERLRPGRIFKTSDKMHAETGDVFYRLAAPRGALDCCIFGYAVRAPRGAIRIQGGRAESDLDGDGVVEHFQSCANQEGLSATVWSGEPNRGPVRWTRYYYLGYDLEPTCVGRDTLSTKR